VYRTSTTAFNVRFIPARKIASKALPLRSLAALAVAFPTRAFATELEDTRPISTSFITFPAPFHLFCAFVCFTTSPYTYLDAQPRNLFMRCVARSAVSCQFLVIHDFFRKLELKVLNPVAATLSLRWSNAAGI
jgi:hypothetical protein